jgi:hypothetical protein
MSSDIASSFANHAECDGPADHHSKRRVPEVFPTMAEALGEMYALPRRLL